MRILRVFTGGTSTQRGCPAGGPARPCRCFFKQHQALPARKFTSACQRRSKTMKKCRVCGEDFEDKYAFCPLDGMPLREAITVFATREFNLTLMGDARLSQRLAIEIQFALDQIKRAWPSFKSDPIAFTQSEFGELRKRVKQTVARPHVVSGAMTAVLVLSALI